ncbi:hypothetical protein NU219Hw_g8108t1 [Hortaea werneckii]
MLQDSVIVFDHAEPPVSRHSDEITAMDLFPDGQTVASTSGERPVQLWNTQTGEQTKRLDVGSDSVSGRFNLLACAQDIIDTWGPGTFIVALDVNREEKIASILLCGGRIFLPDDGRDIYHWSSDFRETAVSEGTIQRTDKVVIAGTMAVNQACDLREQDCLRLCEAYRDTLGAAESYWEVKQQQVGLQAGQYVTALLNKTWEKRPGKTWKALYLSRPFECSLVPFLESTWGLQVSFCSGYARRVKMRELMADLLPAYMGRQIQPLVGWEKLRDVHDVINCLRHGDLPQWLAHVAKKDYESFELLNTWMRLLATDLSDTGIDATGKHFVVA